MNRSLGLSRTNATRHPASFGWSQTLACLYIVAAFGPYLTGGVRTEQVAIYTGCLLTVFIAVGVRRVVPMERMWFVCLLWLCLFLASITSWVGSGRVGNVDSVAVVASVDNLLLPLALIVSLLLVWRRPTPPIPGQGMLGAVLVVLLLGLSLNTMVALAQAVGVSPSWGDVFLPQPSGGSTVASRAAAMGRYSGIFNQPVEAGLAYSLGVLALIHLVSRHQLRWLGASVVGVLIVIGGLLPVSKVFVLGGLPLAVLYLIWETGAAGIRTSVRVVVVAGASVAVALLIWVVHGDQWRGAGRLGRLVVADSEHGDLLRFYTAGRFGVEGHVLSDGGSVLSSSPVLGFGLGHGLVVDNAYLEMLALAGVIGLIIYSGVLIALLMLIVSRWRGSVGRFLVVVLLLIVGGGMGSPVLTMNRTGTLLWTVLVIGLLTEWRSESGETSAEAIEPRRSGSHQLDRC